jgi:hypothetical protein
MFAGDAPPSGPAAPVQFKANSMIANFVRPHRLVGLFTLQVVPGDAAAPAGKAGHRRHPRSPCAQQHEMRNECEMANVVRTELQFHLG